MSDIIMLRCENVCKEYRLGTIGGTTLQEDLHRIAAKLRRKEDPTLMIGEKKADKGSFFAGKDGNNILFIMRIESATVF